MCSFALQAFPFCPYSCFLQALALTVCYGLFIILSWLSIYYSSSIVKGRIRGMPRGRVTFLSAVGALLLAVICWGLAPVANRYLLVSVSPLHLVVLRFVVA